MAENKPLLAVPSTVDQQLSPDGTFPIFLVLTGLTLPLNHAGRTQRSDTKGHQEDLQGVNADRFP